MDKDVLKNETDSISFEVKMRREADRLRQQRTREGQALGYRVTRIGFRMRENSIVKLEQLGFFQGNTDDDASLVGEAACTLENLAKLHPHDASILKGVFKGRWDRLSHCDRHKSDSER